MNELELKLISVSGLAKLRWVERGPQEDELVSGADVFARLHWASMNGSLATGESTEGRWTFKRSGFLQPRVTVRKDGETSDLYTVEVDRDGVATLVVPGSGTFRWSSNTSRNEWALRGPNGTEIAGFVLSGLGDSAAVTVRVSWLNYPGLSFLVLLGWHIVQIVLSETYGLLGAVPFVLLG